MQLYVIILLSKFLNRMEKCSLFNELQNAGIITLSLAP